MASITVKYVGVVGNKTDAYDVLYAEGEISPLVCQDGYAIKIEAGIRLTVREVKQLSDNGIDVSFFP